MTVCHGRYQLPKVIPTYFVIKISSLLEKTEELPTFCQFEGDKSLLGFITRWLCLQSVYLDIMDFYNVGMGKLLQDIYFVFAAGMLDVPLVFQDF